MAMPPTSTYSTPRSSTKAKTPISSHPLIANESSPSVNCLSIVPNRSRCVMRYRRSMKASILLYLLLVSSSLGAEVRKYEFVGETPAYQFSCGECSGPPYWVRAHVEGTFEVRLDYDPGVGTRLSLDARLEGAEGNYGPEIWEPKDWT